VNRSNLVISLLDVFHSLSLHLRRQDRRDGRFPLDDGLDNVEDLVAAEERLISI
jgi:hypothetical protein